MRPVRKGSSPVNGDFNKYEDAKPDLVSRLGLYCSYCERPIKTLLAIEHIEPKGTNKTLEKVWSNFLLACVNCNSCKGSTPVNLQDILLPDRDNTFLAYEYGYDGEVSPSSTLNVQQSTSAKNTLTLVGLDKSVQAYRDSNDQLVALDRPSQRMEAIGIAQESLSLYQSLPLNQMIESIVKTALSTGYFSIWMKVFDQVPAAKQRFIESFKGTGDSGCFDLNNGATITPAPNPDGWTAGSKV
ncbi:HNH endonuclease [Marinomonas sp. TI.3.20]|uniref:HNH endonuclease n=1 Tax=Marinomonas sp. TI.3.20 TaxID=3121296 RepID=UPI00311FC5B9